MIYHFTDTARLPWILRDGELQPGRTRIGGLPDPDFLWATASARGDRTASAGIGAYKEGLVRLVRIALRQEDFQRWRIASADHPDWTSEHIDTLERSARAAGATDSDIDGWYCRSTALPTSRFISIESRSWTDNRWRGLEVTPDTVIYAKRGDRVAAGVEISGIRYFSERVDRPDGGRGYSIFQG